MIRMSILWLLLAALAGGCAPGTPPAVGIPATQPPVVTTPAVPVVAAAPVPSKPASALVDASGTTPEAAVDVPKDAPNGGLDFENNWIFDRYGKFRRIKGGVAQKDGRRYNVIEIELWSDHSQKTVYFDITDNWNAWKPPS